MMALDINKYRLNQALELLRSVRNNTTRAEFHQMVVEHCASDGNSRYPLIEAGQAATETHKSALRNLSNDQTPEA